MREVSDAIPRPAVSMRLKKNHQSTVPALLGGSQSRLHLGGMMAIVVNHHDTAGFASQMKPPLHSREGRQSFANQVYRNLQLEADGNSH